MHEIHNNVIHQILLLIFLDLSSPYFLRRSFIFHYRHVYLLSSTNLCPLSEKLLAATMKMGCCFIAWGSFSCHQVHSQHLEFLICKTKLQSLLSLKLFAIYKNKFNPQCNILFSLQFYSFLTNVLLMTLLSYITKLD